MFIEKSMSISLIHRQKSLFFSKDWRFSKFIIFHQTRITSYFLSSLNSFKFAIVFKLSLYLSIRANESRRRYFVANTFFFCEQIINFALESTSNIIVYKSIKNDHFKALYENRKSSRLFFTFVISYRLFFATSCFFSSFSTFFCFSHICRFCYDIFNFNNDLHRHLRFNYLSFTSRRRQKKTWDTWEKVENIFYYICTSFVSWFLKSSCF